MTSAPYLTRSQFAVVRWGLWAQIVLAVPLIVVAIVEAVALQGAGAALKAGGLPDLGLLQTLDTLSLVLSRLNILALIVTGVAFLIWWHHSVANVRASGQQLSVTPGWAVGMWFVPLANLWLPFGVMKELAATHLSPGRERQVSLWWAAWVIGNIVSNVATRSVRRLGSDPVTQATIAEGLLVFSYVLTIVAAVQLLALTRFVQGRQDATVSVTDTPLSQFSGDLNA